MLASSGWIWQSGFSGSWRDFGRARFVSQEAVSGQLRVLFAQLPPCVVAVKACATAHFWTREISALGHESGWCHPHT